MNGIPFDWAQAEAEMRAAAAINLDQPALTLADVSGRAEVTARLAAAFRDQRSGGLILYGPPGCGKRFLARAMAGEIGATFVSVSLADTFDMEVFGLARRSTPCVLLLEELDTLRQPQRAQLLAELDAVETGGDRLFVLAATNAPWAVDPALRHPGRLDRSLLIPPPDTEAREAILRHYLRNRWVASIDLGRFAARTEGMTGADLAHVCATAAERALLDSAISGTVRMIEMRDLNAALAEVRSSARTWFDIARPGAGEWDELARYLRNRAS